VCRDVLVGPDSQPVEEASQIALDIDHPFTHLCFGRVDLPGLGTFVVDMQPENAADTLGGGLGSCP
jgi:hypothetical protein